MKNIKHIFFDLDHTLWDFDKNCQQTLEHLYDKHSMDSLAGFTPVDFVAKYMSVNKKMWTEYNLHQIDKETIRKTRFKIVLSELGVSPASIPSNINNEFLNICPRRGNLMPYAEEVLKALHSKYQLHILTNGFIDVQSIKMETSGISPYFNSVVTSEHCAYRKPHEEIFKYALKNAGANAEESIMIGDNLEADILGALNAGISAVYYNPNAIPHNVRPNFEISCLSELLKIF
ncbi:YjjG family noncanonical pyrimidine nucleotidase [Aureibacter tunicatorum]|uniref:Hydrolase of the HAD superfamily n=1 Tax=Aureibacter tunicatorum TaxID=866807 RepID=A0AAE3XKL8_9BACT|nr:YjjG family noncanonical pyrimidine nucleotidase [Aureibacter tunicatorum]MDR6238353.1 putative hydrolase of the HAD superfamily [Aureibacter tunicatorum]BDD03385.1 noncanonical pyrimidine nucleotidase, YjjG family protein [Aureibacter tunicatorum]